MLTAAHIQTELQRAQSLFQAGRHGEAWSAVKPLRTAIDSHSQALRLFTLIAQSANDIDAAAGALRRILVIEREPPDILGALADMLGSAGRHDEALPLWTRLAALQPNIAEAHLNRAICAADCGRHQLAVEAADVGLARFPGHPRLLATKAMALKNAGRLDDALAAFNQAVAADPERALTLYNRAVTLRAAHRFEEACEGFAQAERRGLKGAQFDASWAASELEAGRTGRAVELYRRALADDPAHEESSRALTRIHIEYRTGEDPFAHFESRARAAPADSNAWLSWANALAQNRDYEKAAAVAAEASRHHPAMAEFRTLSLFSAGMAGDAAAPAGQLLDRMRSNPDDELLWAIVAQLALRAGMPDAAADAAGRLVAKYPYHQTAWSLLSIAWRLLGDDREQWLCDYDHLVMTVDVAPVDGSLTPHDYAAVVAAALVRRHTTLSAPGNQSLRHGTQTGGALFDDPDPMIRQFREAVSAAAATAVGGLADDPSHPFLSRKATEVRFSGSWSVKLRSGGGHHVPHFHSEGWMSSAYYARLPQATGQARDRHEGWIEFGRPPAIFNLDLEPRRLVEPVEGRLVLFPSYMWHGTVPFGEGERLTAAFDYQPADGRP
jgi:tetratricopeptide (TPR) repeat protein